MTIIIFILILGVIIFVHEFGHFIFAKMNGVYVYEFALGMGPKILSRQKGETLYSLRLIPIGGFCQLAGEDVEIDKNNKVPKDRTLQSKSAWQRFLIMFFGAGFNFLLAILLLFFISLIFGSTSHKPIIHSVDKDMPAYEVGLQKGDLVKSINNHKIYTVDDISLYLTIAPPNKKTKFVVERDGKELTYKVAGKKTVEDEKENYRFGIGLSSKKKHGFMNALSYTYHKTGSIFRQMFVTVKLLFTGGIKLNQLSGPVGIYTIVGEQSKSGISSLLYLMAFLSINVGFINLLPFPAFDGGHILFIIIEKIKGSPVKPETENMIHTIGLFLLMALMIYITFNDILKLF